MAQNIAQQTVSAVLAQVTAAINHLEIRNKYIKFPQTAKQRNRNKLRFYEKNGVPGVIGCIDGTHVAIIRPVIHEERYFCRKNYHSLNVQLVYMEIMSVDASHPGSTHDSFIWSHHPLKRYLESLSAREALWFLGDSGYPLKKTMMTPILDARPHSPEAYYTERHGIKKSNMRQKNWFDEESSEEENNNDMNFRDSDSSQTWEEISKMINRNSDGENRRKQKKNI
ncbi:hypothetical protein ACJJTC_003994 [Scirpophaga incertulas]